MNMYTVRRFSYLQALITIIVPLKTLIPLLINSKSTQLMIRLEEPTKRDLLKDLSLSLIQAILSESKRSKGSDGPENPIMTLISSREEIYLSQGITKIGAPVFINNRLQISKLTWLSEICLKSIQNLIQDFASLSFDTKRVVFDFIKLIMKTLLIFNVNAGSLLEILNQAVQVKELAVFMHRNGFLGVVSHISPVLFQNIEKHRLGGILNLENYFSSSVLDQDKFDICENILEYISNFHTVSELGNKKSANAKTENGKAKLVEVGEEKEKEKDKDSNAEINDKLEDTKENSQPDASLPIQSEKGYFNFRKNFLYKRRDLAITKEKFGNSFEKKLKRLKKEFRAQVLKTTITFFKTIWGNQRLAKIGKFSHVQRNYMGEILKQKRHGYMNIKLRYSNII